jgi:hypothetical protein
MRLFPHFYLIFTALVVVAALAYRAHRQNAQQEGYQELVRTMHNLENQYEYKLMQQKYSLQETIRYKDNTEEGKQQRNVYKSLEQLLQREAKYNYLAFRAVLANIYYIDNVFEEPKVRPLTYQALQTYIQGRNEFTKYCTDTLSQDTIIFKYKLLLPMDKQHEAQMQTFFATYNAYTTAEQLNWLWLDRIYLQHSITNLTDNIIDFYKMKNTDFWAKSNTFKAFLSPQKSCIDHQEPFEGTISVGLLSTDDAALKFTLNGQKIKSHNGIAQFSLFENKADSLPKTMTVGITEINNVTGLRSTIKNDYKYIVSPAISTTKNPK